MKKTALLAITFFMATVLATAASAASLDNIQFLKIAPKDSRAVMKDRDGKLRVIKPGDTVTEGVSVKEITAGMIVLEEQTANGPEKIIVRMTKDTAKIERFRKQPEKAPALLAPVTEGNK